MFTRISLLKSFKEFSWSVWFVSIFQSLSIFNFFSSFDISIKVGWSDVQQILSQEVFKRNGCIHILTIYCVLKENLENNDINLIDYIYSIGKSSLVRLSCLFIQRTHVNQQSKTVTIDTLTRCLCKCHTSQRHLFELSSWLHKSCESVEGGIPLWTEPLALGNWPGEHLKL